MMKRQRAGSDFSSVKGSVMREADEPVVWRICLDGRVEENWADWFAWASVRCQVSPDGGWETVAEGELHDRGALRALVTGMLDRGINVVSMDRIRDPRKMEDLLASTVESWR